MSFKISTACFVFIILFTLTACVEDTDFKALQNEVRRGFTLHDNQIKEIQKKIDALDKRFGAFDRQIDTDRQQQAGLQNDFTLLQEELARLRGRVDVLSHQKQEGLKTAIDQLRLNMEVLGERVDQLEGTAGTPVVVTQPAPAVQVPPPQTVGQPKKQPPESIEDIYREAKFNFEEGDFSKAKEGFQSILRTEENSPLAANAQFWIGECFFREGNYKQAVLEYEKVLSQYPQSAKTPAALLKQGMAWEKLDDPETARYLYNKIISDYPDFDQAPLAEHRLKRLSQ